MPALVNTELAHIETIVNRCLVNRDRKWYYDPAFATILDNGDNYDMGLLIVFNTVRIYLQKDLDEVLEKLQRFVDYDLTYGSMMSREEANALKENCDESSLASVLNTVRKLTKEQLECVGI